MNDFTKKELQTILLLIDDDLSQDDVYFHVTAYHNNLRNKVWTLIDNYCEPCPSAHEFYETLVCHQCGQMEDITV